MKKALSLAMAMVLSVGISVCALAADPAVAINNNDVNIVSNDTVGATVAGKVNNPVTDQEVTIMVVKDGTTADGLSNPENIYYIDQVATEDDGSFVLPFFLKANAPSGLYEVRMGGTNVSTVVIAKIEHTGTATNIIWGDFNNSGSFTGEDITEFIMYVKDPSSLPAGYSLEAVDVRTSDRPAGAVGPDSNGSDLTDLIMKAKDPAGFKFEVEK